MRKNITDLTEKEVKEILKKNNAFAMRIWNDAIEEVDTILCDELDHYFTHYDGTRTYYSLDFDISYCMAEIRARSNTRKLFLADCLDFDKETPLYDDDTRNKIKRALDTWDKFEDFEAGYGDITDTNYRRLETWLDNIIYKASQGLKKYVEENYNYYDDADNLAEYATEYWIETCAENFEVDEEGKVYETITTVKTYQ